MKKLLSLVFVLSLIFLVPAVHADVTSARAVLKDMHWLGHDTFKITGEKVIYTDPFKLKDTNIAEKADIILITHEHQDHCSPEDVKKIQKPGTVIISTPSCAEKLKGNVKTVKPGEVVVVDGLPIEAVPAYNTDKKYHPKEKKDVGFVFVVKGQRIYLAGDTDYIPEMKSLKNINIALLPVSGTYVMTEKEAVKAALDIKPDIAIPMHYGAIIGTRMNAEKFAEDLKGTIEVVIMREE